MRHRSSCGTLKPNGVDIGADRVAQGGDWPVGGVSPDTPGSAEKERLANISLNNKKPTHDRTRSRGYLLSANAKNVN